NELSRFITETQDFIIRKIRQPYKSWWFEISGEVRRNLRKAEGARNIIRSIIRTRKNSGKKFNDLLDMLLDARYEDTGLPMEETQVIDEILILLIAGHETTANALSWTLYLLSRHANHQNQLREETRDLSVQETVRSEWLNALISESLRLYPPAWISDRIALKADQYNNFGFPENTIIILFFYGLHRDPKYWENAEDFMPERFLKLQGVREKLKAFYPFGAGPRLCIGNNFAMAEMTIFLQAMIRRFNILPTTCEPTKIPLVTLRPDQVILNITQLA
ncbi:MAG: cytochrome P450, partial [Bacteroidota bacterium]|nr:cytochrome P450 [Bacteroidota bacterium]